MIRKKYNPMPEGQFSKSFVIHMRMQCRHSYYRYGPTAENAKSVDFREEAEHRLRLYASTGNTEYLVDVAVFAMCEFMYPHVRGAAYRPDAKSPGLVSGVSSKELAELNRENKL